MDHRTAVIGIGVLAAVGIALPGAAHAQPAYDFILVDSFNANPLAGEAFLWDINDEGVACGIATIAVTVSLVVGTAIGVLAAWAGGAIDTALARLIDVFMAFPGILLAIALAGVLGPGTGNVLIALCAVGWVGFARLARAQTLALKTREHVTVARALGVAPPAIVLRHVLPLATAPLVVEASFALASMIVAEAGLSFLGLGAQPPTPSWGSMIRQAMQYLLVAPHMLVGPCVALMSIAVSANLLGDRLRDRWQVRP